MICCAVQKNGVKCSYPAKIKNNNLDLCKVHKNYTIEAKEHYENLQKEKEVKKLQEKDINISNEILLKENLNNIPLRNIEGKIIDFALVNPEDFDNINKIYWNKNASGYAQSTLGLMHHIILGKPEEENYIIDHIDNNRLNNTRENLRFANKSQNSQNAPKLKETTSKYKGVHWQKDCKKWRCRSNGSGNIHLGLFDNEIDAGKQYDTYVFLKYGPNAKTNGLIQYNDIKHIEIESLVCKRKDNGLPMYIMKVKTGGYKIQIKYNKKRYYDLAKTLEEAEEKLKDVKQRVNKVKGDEYKQHLKKPIYRNDEGQATIQVFDKNKKLISSFIVSDDKWYDVSLYSWSKSRDYFKSIINGKSILIHRYLTNAMDSDIVDHINNKKNDNRTENLRISTLSNNSHNKIKNTTKSSKYFGVSFQKNQFKWSSTITQNSKKFFLGNYDIEIKAAIAYNIKAQEIYGNFSNLNDISKEDYDANIEDVKKIMEKRNMLPINFI
jgi:hypothetical protein